MGGVGINNLFASMVNVNLLYSSKSILRAEPSLRLVGMKSLSAFSV